MSRHRVFFWLIAALAALLAVCTRGHFIELWNNTGGDIVITVDDEKFQIRGGAVVEIRWLNERQRIEAEEGKANKQTFAFKHPTPLEDYVERTTTKTLIKMQLNADGFIHALLPDARGIVKRVTQPPPEFPLKPNAASQSGP